MTRGNAGRLVVLSLGILIGSAPGTDADNLQPVDPPDIFPFAWSVAETTLTMSFPFAADTLTSTYARK
jgi:hypothetical protein